MIFPSILLMTLLCIINAKPCERNETEGLTKTNKELLERQRIIAELKEKILSRLNMTNVKPQQLSKWNEIPQDMMHMLNNEVQVKNREMESNDGNLETFVTPVTKVSKCSPYQSANQQCFTANIPNLDIEEITSAKLIAPLQSNIESAFGVIVQYNITINGNERIYDFVAGNRIKETVEIDVLEALREILQDESGEIREVTESSLVILIDGPTRILPVNEVIDINKMVIEVQYEASSAKQRSKRSTQCVANEYYCCTQSMRISIDELNWTNFIVAPRYFNINYCKGDCNDYLQNSSNHAKALNLIRSKAPNGNVNARPCCVPYSFTSLNIMYQGEDSTLKVAIFNDLVASSCGCM